jgi:LuxR family quorum sensing-dependent transcriptional regulator
MADPYRQAFDAIYGLNTCVSEDAILETMRRACDGYGLQTFLLLDVPSRGQRFEDVALGRYWPDEWSRVYSRGGYLHHDPVVRQLRRTSRPFEWRQLRFDEERYPSAVELMRLRREFGFQNAFVVPVPGPAGPIGGISMSGPALPEFQKPAVHMLALSAFHALSDLRGRRAEPRTVLTEREQEVLTWSAVGKTAWDIGELLAISKRTVHEHAQTASRKLGAANLTNAVALALRDNLIAI